MPWHQTDLETLLANLDTSATSGLPQAEADRRLLRDGENVIGANARSRSALAIFVEQFQNAMLILLIAVAIVSAGIDYYRALDENVAFFPKDAIAIFVIVGLNALLGFSQESRAETSLAALRKLADPLAKVVRGDEERVVEVPASKLVAGDLVRLEGGDVVPADLRLASWPRKAL